MPMEECLYGILVASANEVANAVAEHIAGSQDAFAEMMNKKAVELGCKNSHFMINLRYLFTPPYVRKLLEFPLSRPWERK